MAEIIRIGAGNARQAFFRCREVVFGGGVIVYPTDTFYGIGVDPRNAEAVKRLFAIKGRAQDQPILLLLAKPGDAGNWAAEVNPEAERLMRLYWPGPLTLVFKARETVLSLLTAGTGTIGLRVPGNSTTLELLAVLGIPLTGTSANVSGGRSPRTAGEVGTALGDRVDLILDAGPTPGGKPSTIADVTGGRARIIREGAVAL